MSDTPLTGSPRETGAIHDIGYRRYDGERLGPAYIARVLFVHSLRGAYGLGRATKSKVMPLLLLAVMVVPALIMAAVAILTGADELPVRYESYFVNLQVVIAVFVAAQAPQNVSRDLRFQVVSLYFSRPVSRQSYVLAKLLAMVGAVFALLAIPLLVLYAGALLAELSVWDNTVDVVLALAGAAILAVVLASVSLVIAAFTPRRGLGVAAVVTVLLILAGVAGTIQGIARDEGELGVAGWAGLISPFSLVDGIQVWAFDVQSSTVVGPPGSAGGPVFAAVAAGLVAASYSLLHFRYRKVSVS